MAVNKVQIEPKIINWAIQESQIPIWKIEKKFNKINQWLEGTDYPTFNQLKKLCDYLKIPFGYLFLKNPPNPDKMRKEFRTINNKTRNNLSKNLRDVLIDMEFKKNWMSDYRIYQGWEPIKFNTSISLSSNPSDVSITLHNLLSLSKEWFLDTKNTEDAFNILRKKIENIGVIVMINGIVGQNTHRTLDLKEFRAFALIDSYAPLIFINRQDSHNGMIFSLIHELIHLTLNNDDIILDEEFYEQTNIEKVINSFTAEFLIPTDYLKSIWRNDKDEIKQIYDIAKIFNVSPIALAIKLNELHFINKEIVNSIFAITNANIKQKKSNGGNYYTTLSSRLSDSFATAVINQTEVGALRYTEAYRLLGINGKTYQQFKNYKEEQGFKNG